jgi:hypothetical protein
MTGSMSAAISCPQCGSPFSFREGTRNALCPSCGTSLAVSGEAGIPRFCLEERLDLPRARSEARKFLSTSGVDPGLVKTLKFEKGELCFLPFWSLKGIAVGWQWLERETIIREEVVDDNGTKRTVERRGPREQVFETISSPLDFSSPAFDCSAFGLRGIALAGAVLPLRVMDHALLKRRGTVFDPVKGADEVRREALSAARDRSRANGVLRIRDRIRVCGEKLAFISYPVWRLSFTAGERVYPMVVDAINGRMLKGRFPGRPGIRLFAPMLAILVLVYAGTLYRALGGLAILAFLVWIYFAHGLSVAGLAGFFFRLTEKSEDISHG